MLVASWNVNSIRARMDHVKTWLKVQQPDVLLLQELKGTEFPTLEFEGFGYNSVAVTQKAYNGVAVLSRRPIDGVSTKLAGDDSDIHARFLETFIDGLRIVNIYLPMEILSARRILITSYLGWIDCVSRWVFG